MIDVSCEPQLVLLPAAVSSVHFAAVFIHIYTVQLLSIVSCESRRPASRCLQVGLHYTGLLLLVCDENHFIFNVCKNRKCRDKIRIFILCFMFIVIMLQLI